MTKKKAIYTIDGKPAKLRDIRSCVQDTTLKEALGDYISARDVRETRNKVGIKDATLRNWRNSGKIRAKKIGATWFYSKEDLIELIRTSDKEKQNWAPYLERWKKEGKLLPSLLPLPQSVHNWKDLEAENELRRNLGLPPLPKE